MSGQGELRTRCPLSCKKPPVFNPGRLLLFPLPPPPPIHFRRKRKLNFKQGTKLERESEREVNAPGWPVHPGPFLLPTERRRGAGGPRSRQDQQGRTGPQVPLSTRWRAGVEGLGTLSSHLGTPRSQPPRTASARMGEVWAQGARFQANWFFLADFQIFAAVQVSCPPGFESSQITASFRLSVWFAAPPSGT